MLSRSQAQAAATLIALSGGNVISVSIRNVAFLDGGVEADGLCEKPGFSGEAEVDCSDNGSRHNFGQLGL
jgi:prepilin-type processing-associated H-X9-DG protein